MPLISSTISSALESLFAANPSSPAEAAQEWARGYVSYASSAMSSVSSQAITAQANLGILVPSFTSALEARSSSGAGGLMAAGVMAFWTAMVWVGPTAAGATIVPGNFSLASELTSIFEDLDEKSDLDKASELADAFDNGAKSVMVMDILYATGVPVTGPIT